MLSLENVTYALPDGREIISDISMAILPGQLTVITGPNGGGKTSLAKLIAGIYVQNSGRILLDGNDITGMSICERARAGIAYAFQQPVPFKGLSVRALLETAAGEELPEVKLCRLLEKVGLCAREYMDRSLDSHLSGGEMKRIEIATVLARSDAKYIVFDEPEAGIDLWSFNSLIGAFRQLKEEDERGLLIISHQERILEIADEIIVVSAGKVNKSGSGKEIFPTLLTSPQSGSANAYCPKGKEVF